ncbi:MAG: VCBS repeat-containing protein [Acidobacteria bacterium]|nr:VCBS repeat-containing protein [Acidobacteriota bacterium]
MASRPALKRWTHRRVLMAAGIAALGASAILWFTRKGDDAPYTPGAAVEGVTDVLKKDASGAGWGVVFRDVAKGLGLDFSHFSGGSRSTQLPEDMGSGCAFGDYDRDGDWDLFVVDTIGPLTMTSGEVRAAKGGCRLFRNDGGTFTDVTVEAGLGDLNGTFMGAAWGDFDNDGYPDLVVTSYGGIRLFHNRGDGTFEDVTKSSGVGAFKGFFTGAVWGDADGDGLLDLYICGYVDYRFDPKDAGKVSKDGNATSPWEARPLRRERRVRGSALRERGGRPLLGSRARGARGRLPRRDGDRRR